jgi:hypothetical protein
MTDDMKEQLAEWRRRIKLTPDDPDAMTLADYREAIKALRADRTTAAVVSAAKRSKASQPAKTAEQILEGW